MNDYWRTPQGNGDMKVEAILNVLRNLRINVVDEEYELQDQIAKALSSANIAYQKEYRLGRRNRVDFFIDGIVIEVKKGKPYSGQVIKQIERYAAFKEVTTIILVVERNLDLPKKINGKPVYSFGLNKLWGIAL